MNIALLTGFLFIAAASASAQQIHSPADAFNAGKNFADTGKSAAAGAVTNSSGSQNVPYFGTNAAEGNYYANGRNPIGSAGSAKQSNCLSSQAPTAYQQQECDAVNFLSRNPTIRPRFTIDPRTDPLIKGSTAIINASTPAPGTSTQQCRVERTVQPATYVTETCTESHTIDSITCDKILLPEVTNHQIANCVEGSAMPLYFGGWGGGVGYWIDAVCRNGDPNRITLQYAWWNGDNSTKNDGGQQVFSIRAADAVPTAADFNASNANLNPGANVNDIRGLPTFITCDETSCRFQQYQCRLVASGMQHDSQDHLYFYTADDGPHTITDAEASLPNRYLHLDAAHGDAGSSLSLYDCNSPQLASCTSVRSEAYCHRAFTRPGSRQEVSIVDRWDNQCAPFEARAK